MKISASNRLAQLVRRRAGKTVAAPLPRSAAAGLDRELRQRIGCIEPNDPDRRRRVLALYIESVLLAQFGRHLAGDPAFHQLAEQVQQELESADELAAVLDEAARQLAG